MTANSQLQTPQASWGCCLSASLRLLLFWLLLLLVWLLLLLTRLLNCCCILILLPCSASKKSTARLHLTVKPQNTDLLCSSNKPRPAGMVQEHMCMLLATNSSGP